MWTRIKRYFTLPVFADEEKTRVARLLITILMALVGMSLVTDVVLLFIYGWPKTLQGAIPHFAFVIVAAMAVSVFAFARRGYGYMTAFSIVLLTFMWVAITQWVWTAEGLSLGHSIYIYALIIVMAGLLLGRGGAVAYTLLGLVGVLVAYYLDYSGRIPGGTRVPAFSLVIVITVLVLLGVFLDYAMQSMRNAIHRAQRAAEAQAVANRELEAIRLSLEQRVAERTETLERRSIQLQAVAEIGRAAAAIHDLDELLTEIPKMIAERLDFYHVGVFLLDEDGLDAVLRGANSPEGQQILAQGYSLPVGSPDIIGTVTASRELRTVVATDADVVTFASSLLLRTRAELALPLMAGDRLLGALDLHSVDSAAFSSETISVMQLLADQVAIAVENVQLLAQREAALEAERRAYGRFSREAWQQLSRAVGALRFIADRPGVVRPAEGEPSPLMHQAREAGRLLTMPDSTLIAPIQVREGVSIGALRLQKPDWNEDEITLIETLTEQLGAALESARLYQETQRREARERVTREITEDLRRSVDIEVILRSAVTSLGEALGVPRAYVRLMLEGTDIPVAGTDTTEAQPSDFTASVESVESAETQGAEDHES
ncbi:MAG TPA: GAF domain-containing protein [Anaerolineae bacterium]|nr:GAF domain-containing protein [Anaerolineae bacterium]HQK13011.1 GAF domain-containing protein [Anaerolineae bacterium]